MTCYQIWLEKWNKIDEVNSNQTKEKNAWEIFTYNRLWNGLWERKKNHLLSDSFPMRVLKYWKHTHLLTRCSVLFFYWKLVNYMWQKMKTSNFFIESERKRIQNWRKNITESIEMPIFIGARVMFNKMEIYSIQ